jgi:hypothetical protein
MVTKQPKIKIVIESELILNNFVAIDYRYNRKILFKSSPRITSKNYILECLKQFANKHL